MKVEYRGKKFVEFVNIGGHVYRLTFVKKMIIEKPVYPVNSVKFYIAMYDRNPDNRYVDAKKLFEKYVDYEEVMKITLTKYFDKQSKEHVVSLVFAFKDGS